MWCQLHIASLAMSESVDTGLARRTWRAVEAYHAVIYFAPDAAARYEALGLTGPAGYFASRSAALGVVPAEVVIATFYNFNPDLVRSAIPSAWQTTSPEAVLSARITAADATLRSVLGPAVDSPALARVASLARAAAAAVAGDIEGRPLYAAHAALPWPDAPHMVLWHAQTLLREYRGDGHIAALVAAGIGGIEALVTHAATGVVSAKSLMSTRAWPEDDWAAAVIRLRDRGWLTDDAKPALTPEGQQVRDQIEDTTDTL